MGKGGLGNIPPEGEEEAGDDADEALQNERQVASRPRTCVFIRVANPDAQEETCRSAKN